MSTSAGPNIVEDGLVFYVDAANEKSFRGEPTTNVVTNTDLDTGWSKGYQTDIVFDEIDPPEGIDSPVVGHIRNRSSGYWYSYGNYAPQVQGETYNVSMYVKTLDSNFRIRFYTANNSEVGRYWSEYVTVPNDGQWHRIVWNSFTNAANSQSDSLSFNFSYAGAVGDPSTRTWFCAPQMEAKTYATPFVIGTRGTTVATGGGWADLSGIGNNGELSGPIYDSSNGGSLVFDGSNDGIELPGTNLSLNEMTISSWNFSSNYAQKGFMFEKTTNGSVNTQYSLFFNSNGVIYYRTYGLSTRDLFVSNTGGGIVNNQWNNVVATWDGTNKKIYINGVLRATSANLTGTVTQNSTGPAYIGIYGNFAGYPFDGKISQTSVYNRALTAQEIKQNYESLRGRYGI